MKKLRAKKTDKKTVIEFLTKTGFILEMQIAELLRNLNYEVKVSSYFHDYDENKKREIDIIATKSINNINLCLVIECKQSLVDDWIFIRSDRQPARYYQYIKHLPLVASKNKTRLFDNLHQVDASVPLTQNYIIKDRQGKKSSSIQIETCLEKLPKAIIDAAYRSDGSNRRIFFPIAVFSGQMFIAEYAKKLGVKSVERLQYVTNLETENYIYHHPVYHPTYSSASFEHSFVGGGVVGEDKNSLVANLCQKFGSKHLIDFVTKKGFSKLISKLEKEASKIIIQEWPLLEKK